MQFKDRLINLFYYLIVIGFFMYVVYCGLLSTVCYEDHLEYLSELNSCE